MKFLLLVTWDRADMDAQTEPEAGASHVEQPFPWLDELRAGGRWVIGDQLAPPRRARTVRVRDQKVHLTDGPFVETKEALGGFDLIEADTFEEAVEIASRHPVASIGAVEVRPLWGK